MIIKLIYTLFLGILVALFVGLGIDTFYKGPKAPDYPSELVIAKPDCGNYDQTIALQKQYDQEIKQYQEKDKSYNRNVSLISLIAAVLIMIISFSFLSKIKMIADGVLLGGVFTTIYSIIRGLMSEDSRFRFLVVTAGLAIALILGYLKFIRKEEDSK